MTRDDKARGDVRTCWVEIVVALLFIVAAAVVITDSVRVGTTWGPDGPRAGYFPFYIGLIAAIIELAVVPRNETRTRFHAAQGLALHLAIVAGSVLFKIVGAIAGSGFGGVLFSLAALVFLIVSMARVWKGKPHHIAPLDEATRWLNERISPMK